MDDVPYLMRGIRQVTTDSSVLTSSSKYLNDPRLRDWVATHMLRRSGQDRPSPSDSAFLVKMLWEIQDLGHIETLFTEERKKNPRLDAWFKAGFSSTFTKEDLGKCPPGSIGRTFFEYLDERGFQVDLVPRFEPKNQFEYWSLRSGQTHDLEHIIGGVGFDYIGELVPYWMRLTNLFKHLSPELAGELMVFSVLGATRIMTRSMLHYPMTWPTCVEAMNLGIRIGKASEPIWMFKYEDVLDLPLEEARAKLGVRDGGRLNSRPASDIWEELAPAVDDPQLRLWQ